MHKLVKIEGAGEPERLQVLASGDDATVLERRRDLPQVRSLEAGCLMREERCAVGLGLVIFFLALGYLAVVLGLVKW